MKQKKYTTVLSIAGSDTIGGAGIQADIKTCSALGVYAMTAITAVTAQNTTGVKYLEPVTPNLMSTQLEAIIADVKPDAIKIGMIPNREIAEIIADFLEKYKPDNVVSDPVTVATSGDPLSSTGTIDIIKERIFKLSTLVTPNIPESKILYRDEIETGPEAVLVKGGHAPHGGYINSLLYMPHVTAPRLIKSRYIETTNTHGTGCSLSSAIASFLAKGQSIGDAVTNGTEWITEAIEKGAEYRFGHGHGPINHIFKNI